MFDIETGIGVGPEMSAGNWILSISTQLVAGAPLCFVATSVANGRYGVCVFDLATGEEMTIPPGRPGQYLQIKEFKEKTLEAVCVPLDNQGEPIILIAGPYSLVRKWEWPPDPNKSVSLDMREEYGNMYVHSLAAGRLAGKPVAAAGNERGLLAVWDLQTNALLHRVESAHRGSITALAIANWFGTGALISGGSGYVRVWSASLQPIFLIDFEARIVAIATLKEKRFVVATEKGLAVIAIRETLTATGTGA